MTAIHYLTLDRTTVKTVHAKWYSFSGRIFHTKIKYRAKAEDNNK